MVTTFIHLFLSTVLLIAAFFIFVLENPIHIILLLVLIFIVSGSILLMFNIEFVGFLFIMIYVGAIAVLFLFVIMMICTKRVREKIKSVAFYNAFFVLIHTLVIVAYKIFNAALHNERNPLAIDYNPVAKSLKYFDFATSTEILGQALFNYYNVSFLIAGLILLVALIGSIALTLNFQKERVNKDKNLTRSKEIKYFI
jgi:NADH-quinone oxidoreductase subunit J